MRMILMGAPGSGKGTQAEHIVAKYQIAHISTGDLLRAEVAASTTLGQQAKAIMDAGNLVSDDIMLGMIRARLSQPDASNGFLLDGFPRTLQQAKALDALLVELGQPLDAVVYLKVDFDEITQRLLARQRSDDTEATIKKRLQVFEDQTSPLIGYYQNKGELQTVHGMGDVNDITGRIFDVLESAT